MYLYFRIISDINLIQFVSRNYNVY